MPADLDLLEDVYAFARARAVERTQARCLDMERIVRKVGSRWPGDTADATTLGGRVLRGSCCTSD